MRTEDGGKYYCLVNNKVEGPDIVKLSVVGNDYLGVDSLTVVIVSIIAAPTEQPSRPLVTGFTSRTVTISWTKPRQSENSPGNVLGYIITVK